MLKKNLLTTLIVITVAMLTSCGNSANNNASDVNSDTLSDGNTSVTVEEVPTVPHERGFNIGNKSIVSASQTFSNEHQHFELRDEGLYMTDTATNNTQLLYNLPQVDDYSYGLCYGDKVIFSYYRYNGKIIELDTKTLATNELKQIGYVRKFYLYNDKLILPDENGITEYNLLSGVDTKIARKEDFGYTYDMYGEDINVFYKNNELWILSRQQDYKIFTLSLDTYNIEWTGLNLKNAPTSRLTIPWNLDENNNCITYTGYDNEHNDIQYRIDLSTGEETVIG